MHRLMFVLVSVLAPATIVRADPRRSLGTGRSLGHFFGATRYRRSTSNQTGDNIKGTFAGATFECQLRSGVLRGEPAQRQNPPNGTIRLTVRGNDIQAEGSDEDGPFDFVARRPPALPAAPRAHPVHADEVLQLLLVEIRAGASHRFGRPRRHLERGRRRDHASGHTLAGRQPADRSLLCGRRLAWRYPGCDARTESASLATRRVSAINRPKCTGTPVLPRPAVRQTRNRFLEQLDAATRCRRGPPHQAFGTPQEHRCL